MLHSIGDSRAKIKDKTTAKNSPARRAARGRKGSRENQAQDRAKASAMLCLYGGRRMPTSVTMPAMSSAGVGSKARL